MGFAGDFFTEETERQSRYYGVQIEASFVSTGRDSDKPEKINTVSRSFLAIDNKNNKSKTIQCKKLRNCDVIGDKEIRDLFKF